MFNLEAAIGAWRKSLEYKRAIMRDDLVELERHIRDEVEASVERGMSEEDAFRKSIKKMGLLPSMDDEYRKIYWSKVGKRGRIGEEISWRLSMLKNYFTIAIRLLIKQRTYAVINIFGLAIGIAFCLMLLLYVQDELSFDSQHTNADRIARVVLHHNQNDGGIRSITPWMPYPLGKTMESEFAAVESAIRVFPRQYVVRSGEVAAQERVMHADPEILTAFTYELLEGSVESALPSPEGLVISQRMAEKYFGSESALGKTLDIRFSEDFVPITVTGVIEDIPSNNSIEFDFLLPFERLKSEFSWIANQQNHWNSSSYFVYLLFHQGTDMKEAESLLPAFRSKYYPDDISSREDWTASIPPKTYSFQPLRDIHLDHTVQAGLRAPSNPKYSWILGAIALTILLLACINFTTLAIGRSASRAREVGLRKVVGAARAQLIGQFGGEAVLMSVLGLGIGLALIFALLPTFNQLADKDLSLNLLETWAIPATLVSLTLIVALFSGFYPSLVLSRYRPTDMLRKQSRVGGSHFLTKSLVLLQFTLSVGLISGTAIMANQMDFLQNSDVGYDRDHVVLVPTQRLDGDMLLARFESELNGVSEIEGITGMTNAFSHGWSNNGWDYEGKNYAAYVYRIESNFVDVMGMELKSGRSFDPARPADSTKSVIINEAFARQYGWTDGTGELVKGFGDEPEVIGVVRDFNFLSLHDEIEPMMFILDPDWSIGDLLFQIDGEQIPEALDALRATWAVHAPNIPFMYSFLDDDLAEQYQSEERWSKIVQYAAFFAILIACLGLFGLASLSVASRTKEIGIRRVLGASASSISAMLSKDLVKMVVLAIIFAIPLTIISMEKWLASFAFRIEIGYAVFILAAVLSLGVALLTVSFQTIRAALSNPVDTLRSE